jgi:hypothetical protein
VIARFSAAVPERQESIAEEGTREAGNPASIQSPMTALELKAALEAAVTMNQGTAADAARSLHVSYNHLILVLSGDRSGSERLCRDIAAFLARTDVEVFGSRAQSVVPEPRIGTER